MNWLTDHSGKGTVLKRMVQWTVFGAVILLLFLQLRHVNWTELNELELSDPWALVVSICLVLANQFLEFAKWQLVARRVIHDRKLIFRAYWSGVGSTFLTPNGWGSFLGRMIHFGKRDRLLIVGASLQANFSQLTPTLLFGLLAIYLTDLFAVSFSVLSLLFGVSVLLLYFFGRLSSQKRKAVTNGYAKSNVSNLIWCAFNGRCLFYRFCVTLFFPCSLYFFLCPWATPISKFCCSGCGLCIC